MIPTAIPMHREMKLNIGFRTPSQLIQAEPKDVVIPIRGLFDRVSNII
jgi:hypothetical protein